MKKFWILGVVAASLCLSAAMFSGCKKEEQGPMQKLGSQMDKAAQQAGEKAAEAGADANKAVDNATK